MTGFAEAIRSFSNETGLRMDQITRKVCVDLMRDIVRLTPVATGMARSNWFVGDTRITSTDSTPTKRGKASNRRASEYASTLHSGGVFYITNNLPYIMWLEFGSSKQAPAGMARITVDRWQARIDRLARSL